MNKLTTIMCPTTFLILQLLLVLPIIDCIFTTLVDRLHFRRIAVRLSLQARVNVRLYVGTLGLRRTLLLLRRPTPSPSSSATITPVEVVGEQKRRIAGHKVLLLFPQRLDVTVGDPEAACRQHAHVLHVQHALKQLEQHAGNGVELVRDDAVDRAFKVGEHREPVLGAGVVRHQCLARGEEQNCILGLFVEIIELSGS